MILIDLFDAGLPQTFICRKQYLPSAIKQGMPMIQTLSLHIFIGNGKRSNLKGKKYEVSKISVRLKLPYIKAHVFPNVNSNSEEGFASDTSDVFIIIFQSVVL